MTLLQILDHVGVAVFAISGALAARRQHMDPFGVLVLAAVTAIGGGTIRDTLLSGQEVFWIETESYLHVILLASILTLFLPLPKGSPLKLLTLADAAGLALFTVGGLERALADNASPTVAVIMGVITGVAGGMLRDMLAGQVPLILRREIYASASIAGGVSYFLLADLGVPLHWNAVAAMLICFAIRMMALRWHLSMPLFPLK